MFEDQKSIVSNTVAFQDITNTDLIKAIRNARVVSFGENPHGVREYYPIVRDVVQGMLSQGRRVLVLLEYEYWLNIYLDDFLRGRGDAFLSHSFHDPDAGVLYGAGLHRFYAGLRTLHREHPGLLSCRHIDLFLNPLRADRSELVRSFDPARWETSRDIRQLNGEGRHREFAEQRERFLFDEADRACRQVRPDAAVLLAGSTHAAKQGGRPFGDAFVPSVTAMLAERMACVPVCTRFSVLGGEYAALERRDGKTVKTTLACDAWGNEPIQTAFIQAVAGLAGDTFITRLAGIELPQDLAADLAEWTANWDHLVTVRNGTPDMPMKR